MYEPLIETKLMSSKQLEVLFIGHLLVINHDLGFVMGLEWKGGRTEEPKRWSFLYHSYRGSQVPVERDQTLNNWTIIN